MKKKLTLTILILAATTAAAFAQGTTGLRSHAMTAGFNNIMFTFPVDSALIEYRTFQDAGGVISNSGTTSLFATWKLQIDPAAEMSIAANSPAGKADTIEIKPGKQIPFSLAFTTTLTPLTLDRYYDGKVVGMVFKKSKGQFTVTDSTVLGFTAKCIAAPLDTTISHPKREIIFDMKFDPKTKMMDIHLETMMEAIKLQIFDDIGKMKDEIFSGIYTGGVQDSHYDTSKFPPGKYFVRLAVGKQTITKTFEID